MTTSRMRRFSYTPMVAAGLLGIGLACFTGCGPSEEENEAARERGREVMAGIQEDIVEAKSGDVAAALREMEMDEMSRGTGDQFKLREPGRDLMRAGVIRSLMDQGATEQEAQAIWEQQADAAYASWRQDFGEMSGHSEDQLTMLWETGTAPPVEGSELPEASWPADESGKDMARRITVGLMMRYGFSEAASNRQWEQNADTSRAQFIQIVKDQAGVSDERAAELWDEPRE